MMMILPLVDGPCFDKLKPTRFQGFGIFETQCMTATDMQMSYYDCCVMLGAPLFMAIYDNIVHWGVRPIVVYASTVD